MSIYPSFRRRFLTYQETTYTLSALARAHGLTPKVLSQRLAAATKGGEPLTEALLHRLLTTPPRVTRRFAAAVAAYLDEES
jgi:transposase-like protein